MPAMPCFNSLAADRYADEGSRYDRLESAVSHECERLTEFATALFANLDEQHEEQIRDVLYDAALKIAESGIYPPNRHARRRMNQ